MLSKELPRGQSASLEHRLSTRMAPRASLEIMPFQIPPLPEKETTLIAELLSQLLDLCKHFYFIATLFNVFMKPSQSLVVFNSHTWLYYTIVLKTRYIWIPFIMSLPRFEPPTSQSNIWHISPQDHGALPYPFQCLFHISNLTHWISCEKTLRNNFFSHLTSFSLILYWLNL